MIILQEPSTFETRKVRTAVMLSDGLQAVSATLAGLAQFEGHLRQGALPVGSVEFVRAAMALARVKEPENLSYHPRAKPFLQREVTQVSAGLVRTLGPRFIKPLETKLFTGFVYDHAACSTEMEPHIQEQRQAFDAMPADAIVWACLPVIWRSEWRYYVVDGKIKGAGRYDQGECLEAPSPDCQVVEKCINALALAHPYAIDFGVLSTGETALVEVNDSWAIGLYENALTPKQYLDFLYSRWQSLIA